MKNSDISDNKNNSLMWINGSNLTFENNQIHDAGLPSGSGSHTECMYAQSVTNLTLKRNHFYHCSVMDVFITGSGVANGGYVENNVFEKPWMSTGVISNSALAFQFRNGGDPSPDPSNWDFRYNTFVGPLNISSENPVGVGWDAGDRQRVPVRQFVRACEHDLRLQRVRDRIGLRHACDHQQPRDLPGRASRAPVTRGRTVSWSGSVLRDKGSPSSYPSQDLAGRVRYGGAAPDLGAYEGQ